MPRTANMQHGIARGDQIVGDNSPMTPPQQGFGAHDGAAAFVAEPAQLRKARTKRLRHRVIGKIMKAVMMPEAVGLGRDTRCLGSQTAEGAKVPIGDLELRQRRWQSLLIVLRIGPGARDGAHIGDQLNFRLLQEFDKFSDGARGMADREIRAHPGVTRLAEDPSQGGGRKALWLWQTNWA